MHRLAACLEGQPLLKIMDREDDHAPAQSQLRTARQEGGTMHGTAQQAMGAGHYKTACLVS